jgi:hypothetical protein
MMTRKLQTTLYVTAIYLGVFGVVFVFAPSVFERITQSTLPDAKLTLLYGQHTLTFAFVAFMAAREREGASKLSLTILILTAGTRACSDICSSPACKAFLKPARP